MSTKRQVLEAALRGEGCLGKAADDEPVFVLRAQDLTSAISVREWASKVANYHMDRGQVPPGKVDLARADADAIVEWQRAHPDRVKMPD